MVLDLDETLIHCNKNETDIYDFKIEIALNNLEIREVKLNLIFKISLKLT